MLICHVSLVIQKLKVSQAWKKWKEITAVNVLQEGFYFVFKSAYSCFPVLFHFLLYNEVNQTYAHIYPFLVELPPTHMCHRRAPGRAPWIAAGSQWRLFCMQLCPETTPSLPVPLLFPLHPATQSPHVHSIHSLHLTSISIPALETGSSAPYFFLPM